MRIIGIGGVWGVKSSFWKNVASAFQGQFSGAGFVVMEDHGCHPWEVARLKRFGESVVERHDDGEDTLLVGHSMGGILACAIAPRFRRSRIVGVVTIFSPHNFWTGEYTRIFEVRPLAVPVISFEAQYDAVVWWGTKHPQAIQHIRLHSNHFTDLIHDPRIAQEIAHETKRWLFPKT